MQLGNIPKLLTLGALATLASAQVAHANPVQSSEFLCLGAERVGDEFVPHFMQRIAPKEGETVEQMGERCANYVNTFIQENENLPGLDKVQPYFMQVEPKQAPEINDLRNPVLSI